VRPWLHSDLHIWVPSFQALRMLQIKVWGPSGTLVKEQDAFNLVPEYGAQRDCLTPRCIRPARARSQILFYSILFYILIHKALWYSMYKYYMDKEVLLQASMTNTQVTSQLTFSFLRHNGFSYMKCWDMGSTVTVIIIFMSIISISHNMSLLMYQGHVLISTFSLIRTGHCIRHTQRNYKIQKHHPS
jgi:hypothetical protein